MANKNFGKLVATISADTTKFKKETQEAAKEAKGFQQTVNEQLNNIKTTAGGMTGIFTTIGAGMVVNELRQAVQETINTAVELDKLSKIAGVTTDEFQKVSFGAQKLGIDSEKLSDMLKDVNEKFGETLATGGGPLKDFFDVIAPKVGVTADQFRKLSGPEALQLYYDSLQKANVSQKETTFYMEALVSDGSKLIPMLKNSGEGFKAAAAEAERLGLVMSKSAIEEAKNLDSQMKILDKSMTAFKTGVGLTVIPALNDIISFTQMARKEYGLLGAAIAAIGGTVLTVGGVELDPVKRAVDESKELFGQLTKNNSEIDRYKKQISDGLGFKSVLDGNIKSLENENIEIRKKLKERNDIVNADAKIKGLASQQTRIADKIKKDAEDKAAAENRARLDAEKNKKSGGGSKSSSKKEDKPQQDPIDQAYLVTLDSIAKKTRDIELASQDLSATEKEIATLRASPEYALLPEQKQKEIDLAYSNLLLLEKSQAAQKKLNDLIAATPTAKLEEQRLLMQQIADAYSSGMFGDVGSQEAIQKYGEVVNTSLGNAADKTKTVTGEIFTLNTAVDFAATRMSSAFEDFAMKGKLSFGGLVQEVLAGLSQMIIKQQIFNALQAGGKAMAGSDTGWISTIGKAIISSQTGGAPVASANGNVFTPGFGGPNLIPFANGGIFDSPITFPMAGGKTGLMGEAGYPEAIMPLTRINGKLGVHAVGGGSNQVINQVNVTVQGGSNPDETGSKVADAVMRAIAQQEISNAKRYGGLLNR